MIPLMKSGRFANRLSVAGLESVDGVTAHACAPVQAER